MDIVAQKTQITNNTHIINNSKTTTQTPQITTGTQHSQKNIFFNAHTQETTSNKQHTQYTTT